MAKDVLITICGRAGSRGFKNKNLKTFCSKPLVHYSMAAIDLFLKQRSDLNVDVVLNTDSGLLRDLVLGSYPEVHFVHRPAALAGDTVGKTKVFQHSLREMEARLDKKYDMLLDLDITSPLRKVDDVKNCLEVLEAREDLELVMSCTRSRRSPFMNMGKRVDNYLVPVIATDFEARQQTPPCYDVNASIYAFTRDFLANSQSGFIWDARCDVYEMEDTAVLDIDSEEDFILLELIARHLYATRPEFAQVRDAIR